MKKEVKKNKGGRPRGEPTVVIRVPVKLLDKIKALIKQYSK